MTPARSTPVFPTYPPLSGELSPGLTGDPADATWSSSMRALLLLSGAAHSGDPTLARLSDDELAMLRAALSALSSFEPTSAA